MKVEDPGTYTEKKRDEIQFSDRENRERDSAVRRWGGGGEEAKTMKGRRERRATAGEGETSSARRVVLASLPVLIGCWLVAGARHSPETCRRALVAWPGPWLGSGVLPAAALASRLTSTERGISQDVFLPSFASPLPSGGLKRSETLSASQVEF